MHYVIIRDDDTFAFTPPACLERIYRPFLDMGMPVCLATIPEARTNVRTPDGLLEGYLTSGGGRDVGLAPIGLGRGLVDYIQAEACYDVVQHGCHHDIFEFGGSDRQELARRLDRGARALHDAGFQKPHAFVAPYDRMSRAAFVEVSASPGISTGFALDAASDLPVRTSTRAQTFGTYMRVSAGNADAISA